MTPPFTITRGQTYIYARGFPHNCIGFRYRVVQFVVDVPSYQRKVLVRAVDGPDQGLLFCCTEANFASRYRPLTAEEAGSP